MDMTAIYALRRELTAEEIDAILAEKRRQKRNAALAERYAADPVYRLKVKFSTLKYRERHNESRKIRYQTDPEYRQKQVERVRAMRARKAGV